MARLLVKITLTALFLVASVFSIVGCGDDEKSKSNDGGADGDTDGDTDGDSDADAGPDAAAWGRGDPDLFPEDCIEDCNASCLALGQAGGADHDVFPLGSDGCIQRCELGFNGTYWDDVTPHFRCCATQEEEWKVSACGGWLAHPDVVYPCEVMVYCMFGAKGVGAFGSELQPPEGYRWAPGMAVFDLTNQTQTVDYTFLSGKLVDSSRYAIMSFPESIQSIAAQTLSEREDVLPTFVDSAGRVAAATGDVVVSVEDPSLMQEVADVLESNGFQTPKRLNYSKGRLHLSKGNDGWIALQVVHQLNAMDGVTAELDMLRVYKKLMTPDDPMFENQWHLLNIAQANASGSDDTPVSIHGVDGRVSEAWDVTTGDPDTIIAILDDGVNLNHPDLSPNLLDPYNFVEDWESYLGETYLTGHGTSCAGVAGAKGDNGIGVSGVCPDCSILPAMLMGEAGPPTMGSFQVTDSELAQIISDLVDLGAGVISNSWGPSGEDPNVESSGYAAPSLSSTVSTAFAYAESDGREELGTLILFASGNSNQDGDTDTYMAHDLVVSVGAVDDQGLKSYYSNYGTKLNVSAPSSGGTNGITTTATSTDAAASPQYTYSFGGTSSACPFTAGVVGLIISANPELTAEEIRTILQDSADEIDPVWGEWTDGFSSFYGHGMVNAYRAVQMANGTCADPTDCFAPSDVCEGDCDGSECDLCRTVADCADGYVCQALPALGDSVCVRATDTDDCAENFEFTGAYCIPTRTACDLCDGPEVCNQRDDDCNGLVDDGIDCSGSTRCYQDGWGCVEGDSCAATVCREGCTDDEDCGDDGACVKVKTRYGTIENDIKVCESGSSGYNLGCEVLASSLVDEELYAFAECMIDAPDCSAVFADCVGYLPINM